MAVLQTKKAGVTVDKGKPSRLKIAAFTCAAQGRVSQQTVDLTAHAGKRVRIWLTPAGSYSLNPNIDHYWQVAELDVPQIEYESVDTGEVEEDDQPIMKSRPVPLDLTGVKIKKLELPK